MTINKFSLKSNKSFRKVDPTVLKSRDFETFGTKKLRGTNLEFLEAVSNVTAPGPVFNKLIN